MPSVNDYPASGIVAAADGDRVTFHPQGTTYELDLAVPGGYSGPLNRRVACVVRLRARKLFTTAAGGSFVEPIFGCPRVVQGRVLHVEENRIVVRAGVNVIVELPSSDTAIDLECGPIQVGSLVNATVEPGGQLQLLATIAA